MSRTALARTHRPRRFQELVGQDHVSSTLRAAVEGDRVAHAYLFCGPRGVGKTTAARVLAMALNCPEREDGEPCGVCESCERIWSGRTSLDVVEIDAASNRGVDDARDLRERAMYAPSEDERFKVYIVDEAHMLTREAWNALLKILEEPPPRVIFAFATTEPEKIEQTAAPVLSRCQRFDFRRVPVPEILARLETVLEREGVEAEEGALLPIARQAEGGVRDALSLLDQVLSFSGDEVALEDVRGMLGLVEEERYLELFDLVLDGDRAGVFPYVQELVDGGHDPAEFVRGLADALRVLLVLRGDPETSSVELRSDARERFAETASRFEEVDLLRLLLAVSDVESSGRFRRSSQQRIQLEVLLLRLVSMESAVELEDLLRAAGGRVPERGRRGPDQPGSGGTPGSGGERGGGGGAGASPSGSRSSGGSSRAEGASAGSSPSGAVEAGAGGSDAGPTLAGGASPGQIWRASVAEARDLGGHAVALRGAEVLGFEAGELRLEVPPGLAEDLRTALEGSHGGGQLRSSLARRFDTEELRVDVRTSGRAERVTGESARRQRLEELTSVDPVLREAVEKLDLTLKE